MRCAAVLVLAGCLPAAAGAAVLQAGPGTAYPEPSTAIRAAAPGDTVIVAPGTYFDCASWGTDRVTVDGGGAAVFSDRVCGDKAAFVIGGAGTVLRGLTFTHARVPDGNGAGVRMEGGSLLIEDCVFDDEQAAVIASGAPGAELVLRRVAVRHVGVPGSGLPAVVVNAIGVVRVEDSEFGDPRGDGGALRSEALAWVSGSRFSYGAGGGPVLDVSGPVVVEGSRFHVSGVRPAVIRATGPGVTVHGTTLDNTSGAGAILVQDWAAGTPVMSGNTVAARDTEVSSSGLLMRRVKDAAHVGIDAARHLAGRVRRMLP